MDLTSNLLLSALLAVAVTAAVARRDLVVGAVRRFFAAESHATNLAVFRITVFAVLLYRLLPGGELRTALEFSRLPDELVFPPAVLGWVVPRLPAGDALVLGAGALLVVSAALALVGLWARPAAAASALLSIYVLGVPEYFGKVSHHAHHMVWFAALLAASRCADALSVDARRRGRGGIGQLSSSAGPSRTYGLPLRMAWLMIGVVYLFPGLGKVTSVGIDWVLGDNLRNHVWLNWHQQGWDPLVRFDQVPILLNLAAVATVAFEVSFLFLLFSDRSRKLVVPIGFVFHLATAAFMGLGSFWSLQAAYVVFVDWHALAARARALRARRSEAQRELVAAGTTGTPDPPPPALPSPPPTSERQAPLRLVWLTGGGLLVANLLAGVLFVENGWPVASYPTFGFLQRESVVALELTVDGGEREQVVAADEAFGDWMSAARYHAMARRLIATPDADGRDDRLRAFWTAIAERHPDVAAGVETVRLSRVEESIDPERRDRPPTDRVVLAAFDPSDLSR